MADFRISHAPLTGPTARALILELNAELAELYPEEGANHFRLDPEEVRPGRGAFLIADDGETGTPLGCGAVRLTEPGVAEIKRMYVRSDARGRGIGRALLLALLDQAAALGAARVVLETGERQAEALKLYRGAGFAETERFGEYVDSPLSVCMAKTLT
ncbi:GNAT family N-acetyltransferase [Sphaerisporangium sp. NPDC049003]|uniref:GNAT family N-acetyltransferase n=1 Tax=Sphaerisporangium sp. NPDC049003 TaxID=3364517 RepID=UPI0037247F63